MILTIITDFASPRESWADCVNGMYVIMKRVFGKQMFFLGGVWIYLVAHPKPLYHSKTGGKKEKKWSTPAKGEGGKGKEGWNFSWWILIVRKKRRHTFKICPRFWRLRLTNPKKSGECRPCEVLKSLSRGDWLHKWRGCSPRAGPPSLP